MFLRELRKTIRPIMWVVVVGFLASLFFAYTRISSQEGSRPLVKVNGDSITYLDFLRSYQDAFDRYRELTGESISSEMESYLRSEVLSQLINNKILYQEAKKAGIKIGNDEVREQIGITMRPFGTQENFMRYLQQRRVNYSDFEESVRNQIAMSRLIQMLRSSVLVTGNELEDYWMLQNETLELAYLFINPDRLARDMNVDLAEAEKYYQENKEAFKVPDKVGVDYIMVSPDEFAEQETKLTEVDMQNYYKEHPEKFETKERRSASHILIRVDGNAGQEVATNAVRQLEQIRQEISEGADFSEFAAQYSDDIASAQRGGELGFFTYETMTPEFSRAVFSLREIGDLSGIVETPYGFHLIKLTGIEPASKKSFEAVKAEIEKYLLEEKKEKFARNEVERVKAEIESGNLSFEDYAKLYPGRVRTTPFFARYDQIQGLSWDLEFSRIAFSLEPGIISSPFKILEGWTIMVLKEREQAHIPDWDAVKEQAVERVVRERTKTAALQKAEDILSEIREEGKELAYFQKQWEYKTIESVKRDELIDGIYGKNREEFLRAAFMLSPGEVSSPLLLEDGCYIVEVQGKEIPWDNFSQEKEEFRQQTLATKQEELLYGWFTKIREEAKIVDNTSLFFLSPS